MVLNKNENYSKAIRYCDEAIYYDKDAVKAYYHKHVSMVGRKDFEEAVKCLKTAIKLKPEDKGMISEYKKLLEQKKQAHTAGQWQMKNMFSDPNGIFKEEKDATPFKNLQKVPDFDPENPQCFFEISIGEHYC